MFQILASAIGFIVAVSIGIIVFAFCVAVVRIVLDGVLVIVKSLTRTEVKDGQAEIGTTSEAGDAQSENE